MSGNKRFIISGGGTGGHIFPALSIAGEIRRRMPEAPILFVGAQGRMEMERVPAAGYDIKGLPVMGFDRHHLLRNVKVMFNLARSMNLARQIVKDFAPDIAVGVGGYASGPTLKAAQMLGIPTVLQEQNSFAGVTNKQLGSKARRICVAYEGMERFFPADRIVLTGNPIRSSLLECDATPQKARQAMGLDPDKKTVLLVGGSLGALSLNSAVAASLDKVKARSDVQWLWQTGKVNAGDSEQALSVSGAGNVVLTKFITDMAMAYRAADLVISRAGAGTISELQALGKPVILVPSPIVAEDHQTKNAQALASRNAAILLPDRNAAEQLVDCALRTVDDPGVLQSLSSNILPMGRPDAAATIVDEILATIESIPEKG